MLLPIPLQAASALLWDAEEILEELKKDKKDGWLSRYEIANAGRDIVNTWLNEF